MIIENVLGRPRIQHGLRRYSESVEKILRGGNKLVYDILWTGDDPTSDARLHCWRALSRSTVYLIERNARLCRRFNGAPNACDITLIINTPEKKRPSRLVRYANIQNTISGAARRFVSLPTYFFVTSRILPPVGVYSEGRTNQAQ